MAHRRAPVLRENAVDPWSDGEVQDGAARRPNPPADGMSGLTESVATGSEAGSLRATLRSSTHYLY